MQEYCSKPHYLMVVHAKDCVKDKITCCYMTQETKIQRNIKTKQPKDKKKPKEGSQKSTKTKENSLTKLEQKHKHNELKQEMKQTWTTVMESEDDTVEVRKTNESQNARIEDVIEMTVHRVPMAWFCLTG